MDYLDNLNSFFPDDYLNILDILEDDLSQPAVSMSDQSVKDAVAELINNQGYMTHEDHANIIINENFEAFRRKFNHRCKENWQIRTPEIKINIDGINSTISINNQLLTDTVSFDSIMTPLAEQTEDTVFKYDSSLDLINSHIPDAYAGWKLLLEAHGIETLDLNTDKFDNAFEEKKELYASDAPISATATANILIDDVLTKITHLLNYKSITDWKDTFASKLSIVTHTNGANSELIINNKSITDPIDFITQCKLPLSTSIESELFGLSNNSLMKKVF